MHLADLGYIALILAFVAALCAAASSVAGLASGRQWLLPAARKAVTATAAILTMALGIMLHAFVTKDFSFEAVALHTSRDLPALYSVSALYAHKAGSLFVWGWILAVLSAIFVAQKHESSERVVQRAIPFVAVILALFIGLVAFVNPIFGKLAQPPADGLGLNPLLQNFGMLIHPPLLYVGFAGFMVVFAFVMGALLARTPSAEWTNGIRRWTLFAWCTLGLGNLMGAWWAYTELGWGGYWAWDPVENAGIMPWFLGTAFLHSIGILRRKSYMQGWSFALIIWTFVLVLFSPFITHGGIFSELHGFQGSPFVPYVHAALWASLLGSFAILFWRRDLLRQDAHPESPVSREGAFIAANIMFAVLVVVMVALTVAPKAYEAVAGRAIEVDRYLFDISCGPILLVIVFFLGLCPLFAWRRASPKVIGRRSLYPFAAALIACVAVLVSGIGNWYALVAIACGFPFFVIVTEFAQGAAAGHRTRGQNYLMALPALVWNNRPRYGGFIVHLGIVLITIGVVGSSMYDVEEVQTISRGETMVVQDYELTYTNLSMEELSSRILATAEIAVTRDGNPVATLHPENNYWFKQDDFYAEVGVRTTPSEDLFVVLADYDMQGMGQWVTLRAKVNPLVVWMWVGGGMLLLGGAIAFWPERRRKAAGVAQRVTGAGVSSIRERMRQLEADYESGATTGDSYLDLKESYQRELDEELEKQISLRRGTKERASRDRRSSTRLTCPRCGVRHRETDKFCPGCGGRLKDDGGSTDD